MQLSSNRPYLLRAIYEWLVDNNCTPHLVVFATSPGVTVPQQYIDKNGQIILNMSPSAVKDLFMTNDAVTFSARFNGVVNNIHVPIGAVIGIYARENGQGMMFEYEAPETPPEPPQTPEPPAPIKPTPVGEGGKRPSLKVVK